MIFTRKMLIPAMAALAAAMTLSACSFRPEGSETVTLSVETLPETPVETTVPATPEPQKHAKTFTVTFTDGTTVLATETVAEGACPQALTENTTDGSFIIGWRKGDDKTVLNAAEAAVFSDVTYTAVAGPELNRNQGFIAPWEDGLFHPEAEFTRSDASRAVYALLKTKPQGETFLNDVTTRARCYQAATTLVTQGWMSLSNGRFLPDVAITVEDFSQLLGNMFSRRSVDVALAELGDTISRGEAATVFYTLLGMPQTSAATFYPDVAPADAGYAAISALGTAGNVNWGESGKPSAGFLHLDGYLYCAGEDGYFRKNETIGTLTFGSDGRFTSGNIDLDAFVADILADNIHNNMTQEEQLRVVYDYVRDKYLYLKRNLYEVGELGWEIDEALTMFSTGKGNCYNFTAAFWALTRGIGYESVCLSGLVGVGRDPHSWVEIPMDGTLYIFDPETEMSYLLQDAYWAKLFKLTYEEGEYWSYAREPYPDEEAAPTES